MDRRQATDVESLLRDIAFSGLVPPEGARVRGAFRQAPSMKPFALFVVDRDGTEWMYCRSGERKLWRV